MTRREGVFGGVAAEFMRRRRQRGFHASPPSSGRLTPRYSVRLRRQEMAAVGLVQAPEKASGRSSSVHRDVRAQDPIREIRVAQSGIEVPDRREDAPPPQRRSGYVARHWRTARLRLPLTVDAPAILDVSERQVELRPRREPSELPGELVPMPQVVGVQERHEVPTCGTHSSIARRSRTRVHLREFDRTASPYVRGSAPCRRWILSRRTMTRSRRMSGPGCSRALRPGNAHR